MFMAINGQQKISDQSGKYLNHQAVFCSGNQMIDSEMTFPPAKKCFDVPAELICLGNLLGGQVKAICCYPVIDLSDAVTDNAKRFFALINTGCTKKDDSIVKDDAIFWNRIRLDTWF